MNMPDADGNGPADGLPDLPPEWGRVVVPDDASALADEAELLRSELRRRTRQDRREHPLGAQRPGPAGRNPATVPLLIVLVAVLTTVAGLLAVTWPQADAPAGRPTAVPAAPPVDLVGRPLPALDLVDAGQAPVPLRALLPTVILLTDACPCPERVTEAAAAAPPGVTVVAVAGGRTAPPATAGAGVRQLADPAGGLRALVQLTPAPGQVTALLVDRSGTLVRVVPAVTSVEDYRADLARLTD